MTAAKTDTYGWADATASHTADYIHAPIRKLVRNAGARDVLDAGCGNGALCHELSADGFRVVGVDGDSDGIVHARQIESGARFSVGLFSDSPPLSPDTDDGLFDFVVSTEVIEHLYAPHELTRYCFDALRPGGHLAISTPYHGYLKNLMLSVFDRWDSHHTVHWHGGHIKFWSARTLAKLLTSSGFDVTGFIGVGRFRYLWKSMILTARKPV